MPRSGQIIPEYLHPHEETYINDNTEYNDYTSGNSGPCFLNVFRSAKGRDNTLVYFDSISDWVAEYGLPNYRLYGQPAYNAYVSLFTGLATSQSMRVMPLDAAYAHCYVVAKYKATNSGKNMQLKFDVVQIDAGITDVDTIDVNAETLVSNVADADGYKALPLFAFWSRGRGLYGNDYRVRISHDKSADKENDYVNYTVELMSMETGTLTVLESYNVSFYIDAQDANSNATMFVNDILDDIEGVGSKKFDGKVYYDYLKKLFDFYCDVFTAASAAPTEHSVAKLPLIAQPSESVYYVSDGVVKNYSATTGLLTTSAVYPTSETVTTLPPFLPLAFDAESDGVLINSGNENAVYNYTAATRLVAADAGVTYHVVAANTLDDVTLVAGDIYRTGTTTANYVYYKATSESASTIMSNVYEGSFTVPTAAVAKSNVIYYNGTSYVVLGATTSAHIWTTMTNVVAVTDFGDVTNPAVKGDVYTLTTADGDKASGTSWRVPVGGSAWVAYDAATYVAEENPYTMATWDVFGYNKFTTEDDPYMTFEGGTEAIAILAIEGIPEVGGTEGSFGTDVSDDTKEAAIDQAYIAAFQGATGYDKKILSKRRAPIDIMLDAAYSYQVKRALVTLCVKRGDCPVHLDANCLTSTAYFTDFYTQFSDLQQYAVSVDPFWMKVSDPNTGKIIPATVTLWLAQKYPTHYNVRGNHTPLAGETYATMSGYEKNSIKPLVDADDSELKETLYAKYRFNYYEAIDESTYIRGTQVTFQNKWSDLSEENNVLVLFEIKRKIERLAASNRYKWADADNLRLFKQDCDEVFSSYRGTKCKTLDIEVKMNSWEETRYIVHIYLAVVFRTFQKRAIIEIDINPRA